MPPAYLKTDLAAGEVWSHGHSAQCRGKHPYANAVLAYAVVRRQRDKKDRTTLTAAHTVVSGTSAPHTRPSCPSVTA